MIIPHIFHFFLYVGRGEGKLVSEKIDTGSLATPAGRKSPVYVVAYGVKNPWYRGWRHDKCLMVCYLEQNCVGVTEEGGVIARQSARG